MDFTDIGFWAYIYIGIVSLISVIECIADKIAAKRKSRRIPEKNLFILSALGGSLAQDKASELYGGYSRNHSCTGGVIPFNKVNRKLRHASQWALPIHTTRHQKVL